MTTAKEVMKLIKDNDVFGDVVNAASRIQHQADTEQVLITDALLDAASIAVMPLRIGRPPSLRDNAWPVIFLASDESAYMSGVFFPTADGRLCFLIGDVSGKGMPAALFMARAKALVRMATELMPSPGGGTAIGTVNRKVAPPPGLFSARIRPPCDSTRERAMERPRPMPRFLKEMVG